MNRHPPFTFVLLFCAGLIAVSLTAEGGGALRDLFQSDDIILEPDVAFRSLAERGPGNTVTLHWQIEPGYYLYRDGFRFMQGGRRLALSESALPAGKLKHDELFGEVQVYYHQLVVDVPSLNPGPLDVTYQGCKEGSICYPPIRKRFVLTGEGLVSGTDLSTGPEEPAAIPSTLLATPQPSEQDIITQQLIGGRLFAILLTFFGFGVLLSLTPCVYPMIPILASLIARRGEHISTSRAFVLSVSFVLAMATTYAVLGLIAGSFHFNLQAASQTPWLIATFSMVFVLLALSTFGVFSLQMPGAVQGYLSRVSGRRPTGNLGGTAAMGALSALIVGPCVTPPLAGALLYISQTGDALQGGLALFMMGLGFGVPLLVIGTSAGRLLPVAGRWMNGIKNFFGVLLLAVAVWFLERIVPQTVAALLWVTLLLGSGVFMLVLERRQGAAPRWAQFSLGILTLCYGAALLSVVTSGRVSGTTGDGSTLLAPLRVGGYVAATIPQQGSPFQHVRDVSALEQTLARATQAGRPTVLDFYADWCVECHKMARTTFADPAVRGLLGETMALQADVTANHSDDRALLQRFELFGPPGLVFFGRDGQELQSLRLVGFVDAERLRAHLRHALATTPPPG